MSPVIGVILMVAITVTLAAVVGAFVMGVGANLIQPAPQANLEVADADPNLRWNGDFDDYDHQKILVLEHQGGDNPAFSELKLVIEAEDGSVKYTDSNLTDGRFDGQVGISYNSTVSSSGELSVGERLTVEEMENQDEKFPDGQYKVTLIHEPSNYIVDSQTVSIK